MSTLTRQDTIKKKTPPDRHHLPSYLKIPKRQNQEVYFNTHLKWSSVSYIQGKGYDEYVVVLTRGVEMAFVVLKIDAPKQTLHNFIVYRFLVLIIFQRLLLNFLILQT